MDKLKPCPFCGSDGALVYSDGPRSYQITCRSCHVYTRACNTEKEAADLWNRRASPVLGEVVTLAPGDHFTFFAPPGYLLDYGPNETDGRGVYVKTDDFLLRGSDREGNMLPPPGVEG